MLDARAFFPGSPLAELYNRLSIPPALVEAYELGGGKKS